MPRHWRTDRMPPVCGVTAWRLGRSRVFLPLLRRLTRPDRVWARDECSLDAAGRACGGSGSDEAVFRESLWLKGQEATDIVQMSRISYDKAKTDALLGYLGSPFTQVALPAIDALRTKKDEVVPAVLGMMQTGNKNPKEKRDSFFRRRMSARVGSAPARQTRCDSAR